MAASAATAAGVVGTACPATKASAQLRRPSAPTLRCYTRTVSTVTVRDRKARLVVRASPEVEERTQATEIAEKDWAELSSDEKTKLGQMYYFLVQHPKAQINVSSFQEIQAIYDQYQEMLWGPAETLNGRMAMIGFVAGVGREYITGQSVWEQLARSPFSYLAAYSLVVVAAILNRQFGSPTQGIGPFTKTAEKWNGRFAMVGFVILAYIEYQQQLRRAAWIFLQQLQHGQVQVPGVNA